MSGHRSVSDDSAAHISLQALSLCCNSSWSAPKAVGACTLETAAVEGWAKKAIRVVRKIKCSTAAFEAFITNYKNQGLFEPTLQSHELVSEAEAVRVFHTTYKGSGLAAARDFCTQSVYGPLPPAQVQQIFGGLHQPSGAACAHGDGFYVASINSTQVPPSGAIVRGTVHAFGYFALPSGDASQGAEAPQIILVHVSCVDPNGNIPAFAFEGTFPDACKRLDKIAQLCELQQSMGLPTKPTPPSPAKEEEMGEPVAAGGAAAAATVTKVNTDQKKEQDKPMQADLKPLSQPQSQPQAVKEEEPTPKHVDPQPAKGPVTNTAVSSEESARAMTTKSKEPEKEEAPPPRRIITDKQRPILDKIIALHVNGTWKPAKTLSNCLLETCPVPGSDIKALRISSDFNCTLDTLEAFLADEGQVRKYDPTLDKFEVIHHDGEVTVIYTNYKQQSRWVTPRDFCSITATTVLEPPEAAQEGIVSNSAVLLQCSISKDDAKGPQQGYVRGVIHVFGYVATSNPGGRGIKVYNIARIDPSGSIPKWVLEAAQAENCKKLAAIRDLCEQWEKRVGALQPVKRTPPAPVQPVAQAAGKALPGAATATPTPAADDKKDAATKEDESKNNDVNAAASAEFHSCLDEDDFEEQMTGLKNFYDPEAKAVCDTLINLHTNRGWQEFNFISGCRVETMRTSLCDKKAVRVSCDFCCTLEAFRATLSKVSLVPQYDPSLERLEILNSPPYGTVLYTAYKAGSRLASSRDFCILCCERLLSEEEGAEAGLYTQGIHSAAFVQSSVNSKDMPEQKGYVRGVVHAYGYIAIATPPEAERIRVFNIALVDPSGSVSSKMVDAAVGDTCHKLEAIRRLAEEGAWQTEGAATPHPSSTHNTATPPMHPETAPPTKTGLVAAGAAPSSKDSPPNTAPFFEKIYSLHTSHGWSEQKQVGKCLVDTLSVDIAGIKAQRFSCEFMCSLTTFAEFLSSTEDARKFDSHLETIRYLDSPPNAVVTYTAYRSTSRFLGSRDFCTLTASRRLNNDEACDLGLFTKGITSEVFVQSSVNANDMPEQPGFTRGIVHIFGYLAIATPPTAKRIRVFHYACIDPCGSAPSKVHEYTISETASKLTKMGVLCQQREADKEAARRSIVTDDGVADAAAAGPVAPAATETANRSSQEEKRVSFSPMTQLEQQQQEEEGQEPSSPSAKPASTSGLTRRQRVVFERLLKLHHRTDWKKVSVTEECVLEECGVEFSDKKAFRITSDFKVSLETFAAFLADQTQVRKYDPTLDKFEVLEKDSELVTIYTSYKQQSRWVTPRDFCTITSSAMLPGDVADDELSMPGFTAVYMQNSGSTLRVKPEQAGLVRGQIHVFGYIATAIEGTATIKVHNIVCADPGGSIPKWIMDAAKTDNCKKLAMIRQLCEAYRPVA